MTTSLDQTVEVDGTAIRYGVSGVGDRTLVLLHGHQANSMWWHAVLPLLQPQWRIVRFDLSGHGESGHRESYRAGATWVDELHAVMASSGTPEAILVGHSMGGRIALASAAAKPAGIEGVITLDSALRSSSTSMQFDWHPERRPRVRATRAEALGRFRLAPGQPDPAADVLAAVAESSVRREADGWTWKYDQRGLPGIGSEHVEDRLAEVSVPVRFVYAEHSSIVGEQDCEIIRAAIPAGGLRIVPMAGVHHHLVLDAPKRCADLVDELAAGIVR